MNDQRTVVFEQRREFMGAENVSDIVADMRTQLIEDTVATHVPEKAYVEQWDLEGLRAEIQRFFDLDLPILDWGHEEGIADEEIRSRVTEAVERHMEEKNAAIGPELMGQIEKAVLLQTIDHHWREHLVQLDQLRQVIGFRGYAQRDPLNEYKSEAFVLFEAMLNRVRQDVTAQLSRVQVMAEPPLLEEPPLPPMQAQHINPLTGEDEMAAFLAPAGPAVSTKVARNAPCPCGSGKKYKHCHGKIA
jgi:preprotein translocase subunit SecA